MAKGNRLTVKELAALEDQLSRELYGLFQAGGFDNILKRIANTIKASDPDPATAMHLTFSLNFIDIQGDGRPHKGSERRRALGHLAVDIRKTDNKNAPHIRTGISPSFIDDVTPCPSCRGSGVLLESAKTPEQLPKRSFDTAFREIR